MPRQAFLIVLTCCLFAVFAGVAEAGMPSIFRRQDRAKGGMFPGDGDVPDLSLNGKILTYKNDKFQQLYGSAGNRYIQFGLISMTSADYTYGAPNRRISVEIATMESPTAAAGLFHHHRGKIVREGESIDDLGAECVLDKGREGRNLYFYRSNMFVKIVYSGKAPVPSLMPIARYIDGHLPSDRDEKPEGFDYIDIEGVNKETIALTPGFTFNIAFLPPSVWASAPGGGSPASDMFIITRRTPGEAAELFKDYHSYLKLHAEYVEEYKEGDLRLVKGVDPNQGRVLVTAYKNVFIIAARPDGYEKGEVLIERVIEKIDAATGGDKPRRRGLFRRK